MCDLDYCRSKSIPVVRRHNPGGAVYQDEGSFCFSLFFTHEELFERLQLKEATQLYPVVADAVIATCAEYGLQAAHSPTNDCTIAGRKIYGSAQVEWDTAFVHSGTFLVSTDCEVMARALRPSQLKFADKGFTNVRDRVITLCEAAGRSIPVDEVMQRMTVHLAQHLGVDSLRASSPSRNASRSSICMPRSTRALNGPSPSVRRTRRSSPRRHGVECSLSSRIWMGTV